MKVKNFSKRMTLKKETIVNLENSEMKRVYGGSFDTCYSDCDQNTCDCTEGSCPSFVGTFC